MKIILPAHIKSKIDEYVHGVDTEISGFGAIECVGDDIRVTEIALFHQTVSGVDTEITPESQARFLNALVKAGKDPSKWLFWWHSHVNMGVFWSATDRTAMHIDNNTGKPFLVSVVFNKKGERLGCIDVYKPLKHTIDNVPVVDEIVISEETRADIGAKVTKRVAPPTKYTGKVWGGKTSGSKTLWGYGYEEESFYTPQERKFYEDAFGAKLSDEEIDEIVAVYGEMHRTEAPHEANGFESVQNTYDDYRSSYDENGDVVPQQKSLGFQSLPKKLRKKLKKAKKK